MLAEPLYLAREHRGRYAMEEADEVQRRAQSPRGERECDGRCPTLHIEGELLLAAAGYSGFRAALRMTFFQRASSAFM